VPGSHVEQGSPASLVPIADGRLQAAGPEHEHCRCPAAVGGRFEQVDDSHVLEPGAGQADHHPAGFNRRIAFGFVPGGARPKASVIDQHGNLAIAKFSKETDDYRIELWETVAMQLAKAAGIVVPVTELLQVADKPVLLSRRFDRDGAQRIPFLSGLSMMGLKDGQHGSYPELVDALTQFGARASDDAVELFRRMVLNILISNVDDHLRNHGFLWRDKAGWTLSPVYDLNPVPADVKPRILTTNIDLDEATCDIDLVLSVAGYFGLTAKKAKAIISQVGIAASTWRDVARRNGAKASEIDRMASAFEHDDLQRALHF
jgi:serine/threonine-protein kinase HipA